MTKQDLIRNIGLMYPYKPIKLISNVDRYGFSDILSEQIALSITPRSFANWLHGWSWWKVISSTELIFDRTQKQWERAIVSNHYEKEILRSEGFKNIWVGGLPFAYTPPSNFERKLDSLLAMPPHSAENEKIRRPYLEYLDYLESIKNNYSTVCVSIFHLDKNIDLVAEIEKRGLMFIDGARPDDGNSLRRMRAIFDSFEYVTSNTIGSHIIYAIYCGCKTSFCGPMYVYDESLFRHKDSKTKHSYEYIQNSLNYLSINYLLKHYSFLFAATPKDGFLSRDYGKYEIGYFNKMSNKDIMDALRWGWLNQISGYSSGAIRRMNRTLNLARNKFTMEETLR